MNTEALECFIKVYERKSVTAAAKDLFITPQGLSKTIKQLEMDLETELFYRGPRGVVETEYGELLYARAKHICYLIEDLKHEINIINGNKNVLNVVVTYSSTPVLPTDLLFELTKEYPNIKINIKEVPDEYPISKLFDEEVVEVGLINVNEKNQNYNYEQILSGECVAIVSKDHALASKDEISILELENEQLIVKAVEEKEENKFILKCLELGFIPKIKYELGNVITARMLCKRNGFVFISIDYVEEIIKDDNIKIIRIREKIEQNIYLVTKKRPVKSKIVSLFKSYINEYSNRK